MARLVPPGIPPSLERKLATGMHLASIVCGPLAPLAAGFVWGLPASPWLRQHMRDCLIHWTLAVFLFVTAFGLDTMNPVYDFGLVPGRLAAFPPLGITRGYVFLGLATSGVFATISGQRAMRGEGTCYPLTLWWARRPRQDRDPGGGRGEAP
jgi:hypothetical protein